MAISDDWINPYYGARDMTTYSRFDPEEGSKGLALTNIKDATVGGNTFDKYMAIKPGQSGYDNAQNYISALKHNTGISDWKKASAGQKTQALLDVFSGYQEDNQKSNKFNVGSLVGKLAGPIAGFATGNPWIGAAVGGLGGGATGGLKGAAFGALGGYGAGNSGLFGGDGFLGYGSAGNATGPLQNFLGGNGWTTTAANAGGGGTFGKLNSKYFSPAGDGGLTPANFGGPEGFAPGFGPATQVNPVNSFTKWNNQYFSPGTGGLTTNEIAGPAASNFFGGNWDKAADFFGKGAGVLNSLAGAGAGEGAGAGGTAVGGSGFPSTVSSPPPLVANALSSGSATAPILDLLGRGGGGGNPGQAGRQIAGGPQGAMMDEPGRLPGYQRKPFANFLARV